MKRSKLPEVFAIDPRSLAAFRMGMGALLLVDLAIRAADFEAMYTDAGIMSVEASARYYPIVCWSLHWLSGAAGWQVFLFIVAAVFALMLLLGYRSRTAMIVSWILLCSLHVRNPLILNRGDAMFRMMLFWGMFLPVGQVWSLDARRKRQRGIVNHEPVLGVASAVIILQICIVYWYTGLTKFNALWLGFDPQLLVAVITDPSKITQFRLGGDAMQNVCTLEMYTKSPATFLAGFPTFLRVASVGTVVLELIGPAMLLLPWGTRYLRMLVIAAFLALHVGIELTLHVGLFSFVSIFAWLLLLPKEFWAHRWTSRFAALFGSKLGWSESIEVPGRSAKDCSTTSSQRPHPVTSGVCLSFLGVTTLLSISTFLRNDYRAIIQWPLRPVASLAMIHYTWTMFHHPPATDSWYVYRGTLRDGEEVDLFRNGSPITMQRPKHAAAEYPNHRWRKLHMQLLDESYSQFRQPVADYMLRHWNEQHPNDRQVIKLEMLCFHQRSGPHPPLESPIMESFAVAEVNE